MGIQIANAPAMPQVVYNRVHVLNLQIEQVKFDVEAEDAPYSVTIDYCLYGVIDGIRFYSKEPPKTIKVPSFLSVAMQHAAQGDMSMVTALQSMEIAVSKFIEDQLGTDAEVI